MFTVIMAGGVGERFWPRSRREKPKQVVDLTGGGPMISITVDRVRHFSRPEEIFIITNAAQKSAILKAVDSAIPQENVIGEPAGRNTAAAIGLAARVIEDRFGDQPFIVLPADHVIDDLDVYERTVAGAGEYVSANECLLTFGIKPTRPDTGYGYVEVGARLDDVGGAPLYAAKAFHEKPDTERAVKFVSSGKYFWNSGMFLWRCRTILDAIRRHLPELHAGLTSLSGRAGTGEIESVLNSVYAALPAISIDYGVMEKADNVVVVEGTFYWNDVGSWESIRELYQPDETGNVLVGSHLVLDGKENTVFSPERTVALLGVDQVVVVDSGDAILVCHRDKVQEVRRIVEAIKVRRLEKLL